MTDERPEGSATTMPETPHKQRKLKPVLAGVFWLLASISVIAATLAPWAHQTLLTSGGWGNIVGDVIERPEVQEAVATVGVRASLEGARRE